MFDAFERTMALRYLRARRKEGFVSVIAGFSLLGIALGVATLIVVMAVMNGFRAELLDRILGLNGHVTITAQGGVIDDFASLTERLEAIPGVRIATPAIEGQVLASAGGTAGGVLVRGMSAEALERRGTVASTVIAGDLTGFAAGQDVLIGARMAERFGIGVGDAVTLISPNGTVTAFGTVPRTKTYRVGGVFEVGMYEYDDRFVFLPLAAAQAFFRLPNAVDHIELITEAPDALDPILREVHAVLGRGWFVGEWSRSNAGFFQALEVERNVMFLILTMIILVAAFNIVSGLTMLVKDKVRAVAILRTMGATQGAIMRIFFLAGASVGIAGTALGVLLGIAFAENIEAIRELLQTLTGTELFSAKIYFLTEMPADVRVAEVALVAAMAVGLSLVATLLPSWRAARLDPVEALRYE